MSQPVSGISKSFTDHVHICLTHFYDYPFLNGDELVISLTQESTANRVELFREITTTLIERLKPDVALDLYARTARSYHILTLRYVDQQPINEIMERVALSRRQFFRDHAKAIEALAYLFWMKLHDPDVPPVPPDPDSYREISIESEVQRFYKRPEHDGLEVNALLNEIHSVASHLTQKFGVAFELHNPDTGIVLHQDRVALRQAILGITSQLVTYPGAVRLRLSCSKGDSNCRFSFHFMSDTDVDPLIAALKENTVNRLLIELMDADTAYEQSTETQLTVNLNIPMSQRTVLIVEDNDDVVALFRYYLRQQPYRVLTAVEEKKAIDLARDTQPDLIILDILLPGHDGFDILQNLKNHWKTRDIPVVVCSVLDTSELMFSLGADDFLKKPPKQDEFLSVLKRLCT